VFVPLPQVEYVSQQRANFGRGHLRLFFPQPPFLSSEEPQSQHREHRMVMPTSPNHGFHIRRSRTPLCHIGSLLPPSSGRPPTSANLTNGASGGALLRCTLISASCPKDRRTNKRADASTGDPSSENQTVNSWYS
jgi:hypothetical protein